MATATPTNTETVFARHLQAILSRDMDSIIADFAPDAVVFTPNGAFKGHAQIRGFFEAALQLLTPEAMNAMQVIRQEFDGEFVYVLWSAGQAVPFAGDSFCIRDGKIVMQSFTPAPNA
jgi:ketosteroid isomerase-like protein